MLLLVVRRYRHLEVVDHESLRPYQNEGVRRLVGMLEQSGGAILGDDMGLGKTRQAIRTADVLCPEHAASKLVVAPALARETWIAELERWSVPLVNVGAALPVGSKRARLEWEKLAARENEWTITSYELLDKVMAVRFEKRLPAFLIVDEAHMLKGRNYKGQMSKRAQEVYDVAQLVPWKLLLTGTPLADRPRDLYNLLLTISKNGRKAWGTPWGFDVRFCNGRKGEHGWLNDGIGPEDIRPLLAKVMVRREKADVAEQLPSLTRQVVWLDGDAAGEAALNSAMLSRSSSSTQAALLATLEAKMPAALELASEARQFLLLTWLKEHARRMGDALAKSGTPCYVITGDMATSQREKVVAKAAEERVGVVATLDSVWQSMDSLKRVASVGIMHALHYQWLKMAQGEARLHRMGQQNNVHWYYLACRNTMDELIILKIVEKMDQFRSAIESSGEATSLRDALTGNDVEDLAAIYAAM